MSSSPKTDTISSVVTVHGLRDDQKTVWKSKSGKPWLRDRLFDSLSVRQLDYFYAVDESARVFQPHGIETEAKELLRLYSEWRRGLLDVSVKTHFTTFQTQLTLCVDRS